LHSFLHRAFEPLFRFSFTVESFFFRQLYLVLFAVNQWILRRILGKDVVQRTCTTDLVHLLVHCQPVCPAGNLKIIISDLDGRRIGQAAKEIGG
jgi:hypothetical protein